MSEERNLSVEDIQNIENVIGYTFKNKALLEQAFTRSSYVNEHKGELSNEVLEFYGDRALDITVTTTLAKLFGFLVKGKYRTSNMFDPNDKADEGYLSNLRSFIVCKESLAGRITELDLDKYLRTGKGDLSENKYYSDSVKEDLFEAICGAIAIENEWKFEVYSPIIEKLVDLKEKIKEGADDTDEIRKFKMWHLKKFLIPAELAFVQELESGKYGSLLQVDPTSECLSYEGYGDTAIEAIQGAYLSAYHDLFIEGKRYEYYPEDILEIFKESWLKPTKDNAINIVQEMEQAKIIEKVNYEFEQDMHNEQGNPLWKCKLTYSFNEHDQGEITCGRRESKTEIKKEAALHMIDTVFDHYNYKKKDFNPFEELKDN